MGKQGRSSNSQGESAVEFVPLEGNSFRFRCHRHIACFTKCCAKLNLVLTPYDILRIKKRLGIPSHEFLDRYTETRIEGRSPFPRVVLKMRPEKGEHTCPFLSRTGCTIYGDRPSACRIYPLGRGAMKLEGEGETRAKFFLVKEKHCLGFREQRKWSIKEWLTDQGLEEYIAMNDLWSEVITSRKSLGPPESLERKLQMFCMASYNLDRFREFLFNSRFFKVFSLAAEEREALAQDDLFLLRFSLRWLKFSLFGERTLPLT